MKIFSANPASGLRHKSQRELDILRGCTADSQRLESPLFSPHFARRLIRIALGMHAAIFAGVASGPVLDDHAASGTDSMVLVRGNPFDLYGNH
ncbi:MAG: hypothetical protein RBT55_04235 [Rhodocyclaceae bacterium]|jgi:hypothetical protein|nr:hypothetical protein [Rhodocyclaceae bacterium]